MHQRYPPGFAACTEGVLIRLDADKAMTVPLSHHGKPSFCKIRPCLCLPCKSAARRGTRKLSIQPFCPSRTMRVEASFWKQGEPMDIVFLIDTFFQATRKLVWPQCGCWYPLPDLARYLLVGRPTHTTASCSGSKPGWSRRGCTRQNRWRSLSHSRSCRSQWRRLSRSLARSGYGSGRTTWSESRWWGCVRGPFLECPPWHRLCIWEDGERQMVCLLVLRSEDVPLNFVTA